MIKLVAVINQWVVPGDVVRRVPASRGLTMSCQDEGGGEGMFSVTTGTVEVAVSVFRCIKFLSTQGKGKTRLEAQTWPAILKK